MINSNEISVVLQGAFDKRLTLEAIQSIKAFLPKCELILSTWEGTRLPSIEVSKLVLSKDPGFEILDDKYNVKNNVNRQIVSTKNGILASSRKYVLKLRSDVILTSLRFIEEFSKDSVRRCGEYKILKQRVVINNLYCANGRKTKFLFHVSDWCFFGLREDVLNIFDIPLAPEPMTSRYFENKPRPKYDPIPSWLFQFIPEQYIWLSFLNKNFIYPKVSYFCSFSEDLLAQSEKIFANNLIILNYENFGIKFKKFCPYKWDYFCQYTHLDWLKMCKKYCDPDLDLSGLREEFKSNARLISNYSKYRCYLFEAQSCVENKSLRSLLFFVKSMYYLIKFIIKSIGEFFDKDSRNMNYRNIFLLRILHR